MFEPYRDLRRGHEDQLTRAAMIVLRLVPLARETLLHEIGERSQSQLPDCTVDMQATHIVADPPRKARRWRGAARRLVSVFLTPDFEPPEIADEVTDTDRGQRFDGVLRFDPELVVLLESKVCRRWARRNGHRVAELNLGGARFAERRTCLLRWHDLLESWWRLAEIGVLGPAEQALVQDMLGYAHQDFGHLLPFGSLRRVGADPTRRKWRLRSLLREATGIQPERVGLVHVRLDTALGVASLQRAALDIDDERLTLHLWPGELKRPGRAPLRRRARRAPVRAGRRGALARGAATAARLSQRADARTRVYLTCTLDAATYARRWQGEDWSHVGAHHRETIHTELWPWLLERGYASEQDAERLDPFLRALGRRFAHLRPSMHVSRSWPLAEAQKLDDDGRLAGEIREALNRVLGILDEPLVHATRTAHTPAAASRAAKPVRRSSTKPHGASSATPAPIACGRRVRALRREKSRCTRSSSLSSAWNATASIPPDEPPPDAVDLRQDLHVRAVLGDPRRADEDPRRGLPVEAAHLDIRLEALDPGGRTRCAPRGCPSARDGRDRA